MARWFPGARISQIHGRATTIDGLTIVPMYHPAAALHNGSLREVIAEKGAIAVIPNNPSRALKIPLDKHLYAQRHLVECCFSKLKQFRRVATRYEKKIGRAHV